MIDFMIANAVTNDDTTDNTKGIDYQNRYLAGLIADKQARAINPNIYTDNVTVLKPQRIKRRNPMQRISGGKANFDGDLGVYVPDYRPTDTSILPSSYIRFTSQQLEQSPELVYYSGKNSYFFLRRLSDLYRYSGYTCPHIYMMLGNRECRIGTIKMVDYDLMIRFVSGLPVEIIQKCTKWVSSYVLEDIGTLYPIPGGLFFKYRPSVDCLESLFLETLGIDRALVYAATDSQLREIEPKPINLMEVLPLAAKYGNAVTAQRYGKLYLMQDENRNVIVSRMQFKPRQFIYNWLLSHPIAPNRSIDRDSNPVTGKKARRQYNRAQKSKKYGKGKGTRG